MKRKWFVGIISLALPAVISMTDAHLPDNHSACTSIVERVAHLESTKAANSKCVPSQKPTQEQPVTKAAVPPKKKKAKALSQKMESTKVTATHSSLYLMEEAQRYVKQPKAFSDKVKQIATSLEVPPEWIMGIIHSESNFNPLGKNRKGSGATGLIQLMPSTCRELGIQKISESALDQLDYVYQYLNHRKKGHGAFESFTDVKLSVLYPRAVGKDEEFTLYANPSKAYRQNKGLDKNRDGKVTVSDVEAKMKADYPTLYEMN